MGGGYFQFFTKSRPQKHKKHAILHTSQANGKLEPPPPPLATLLVVTVVVLSVLTLYGIFPHLSFNITTELIFISATVKNSIST